ncbi:MAG: MG2 domain-containing protein [Cytophagales bacterium]|nr:MG2 domain-containing protein [Cytophagales bacterium]
MRRYNYFILISGVLFIMISGFRLIQYSDFLQKLKQSLLAYNTNYPEEKVYLQFDKPFYKPGEDIWFNAFVLNSNTHQPTGLSDVVYVELIDPKGNVASRLALIIKEGTAHGDFHLQETAPGGLYQIRAFTRWMKNFGKDNLFKKDIQVQRVITPRLLLKLDYEKESYGPGDEVNAQLIVTNLKNEKVANASIGFSVNIDGTEILESKVFSDAQGLAKISFRLPDSLNTTDGLLQAIIATNGMGESISRSIPIVLNKITVQFFPEGGYWVENVNTRIAFKAVNEFGKGADISGTVIDGDGHIITQFESFHRGMGAFDIKPLEGKKYFVRLDTPAGNETSILLPPALVSGFVLNLKENSESFIEWLVHAPVSGNVHLVSHVHGEIVYAKKVSLVKGENLVKVSTEKFPAGIAVFTLFDKNGVEQCERLVFLKGKKGLNIRLHPDKKYYSPREKVELTIETSDSDGKPIPARLSLSVTDDRLISFADDKQDNILSAFLLSSEVKGEVQEPSFYFDPQELKAAQALDYLLMTQGWRRFTWQEVKETKRTITITPEKVKNLTGRVVNTAGDGFPSEVILLETGNRKRIASVQTTKEGNFVFRNIDPTIPVLLFTKKPGQIILPTEKTIQVLSEHRGGTTSLPDIVEDVADAIPALTPTNEIREFAGENELNISLVEDNSRLEEIIVLAYGVANKNDLVGSVVKIGDNRLETIFSSPAVENVIQGRVAGVTVKPQTGNAGSQTHLTIRGNSSLSAGSTEPLYVINGHPAGTGLNQNFSNSHMIGPDNIQTIEFIHSPEATALFGSAAAHGAILITTWPGMSHYLNFKYKKNPARYSYVTINPRQFSPVREFYIPPPASKAQGKREDFRSAIYWKHTVATDEYGKAKLSFYNNDAVSAFRITAEGITGSGLIGRNEEAYYTRLPFSLDAKLPDFLGFEDVLKLPVRVKNETASVLTGKILLTLPGELSVRESTEIQIQVPPQSSKTYAFTIASKAIKGTFPITLKLESPGFQDEIKHWIDVQPAGFPVSLSFAARELDKTFRFTIHDPELGSVKGKFTAFPEILGDLFTGAESILRMPHGCFEQVSSSTFPNILALQFLNQSGTIRPDVEKRALFYIKNGYKKLTAYEINGGGFEWFGDPPAHEGLSAYGLLQFHEMKKVFPGVDEKMVNRTRDWLLSRRTGRGGFKQNLGKYGFSAASKAVNDAYITFALSETGTKDMLKEYNHSLTESLKSRDMYRMALMANVAFNLGKPDDYSKLIHIFREKMNGEGIAGLKMDHSIVRGYGTSLQTETAAHWAVALMKAATPDYELIEKCMQVILNNRHLGGFGSTQATATALKALTAYAQLLGTTPDDGEIQILVDHQIIERLPYEKETKEKLVLDTFARNFESNKVHSLRILYNGTGKPLSYSVDLQWYTKKPLSNAQCQVSLATSLDKPAVKVNETVRLTASLKNKSSEGLPMTMAVIGIPAGLSVQPWQLKELQEKQVFDFYELEGGKLILYYREMAPKAIQTVKLDLKAEIPGTYTGAASSAYLYYTDEYKHWVEGNSISIN